MLFDHLKNTNKGYFSHMYTAIRYSLKLYLASQALVIHALIPCLFETTASTIIKSIIEETKSE